MLKKIVVVSAVLAMSSTMAYANSGTYKGDDMYASSTKSCGKSGCPSSVGSPYIGADIGARYNWSSNTRMFEGYTGNIVAGYGFASDDIYLAGELFAQETANLRNYTEVHGNSLRSTWDYGVSFIPGVFLAERTILFGRIGVVNTNFTTLAVKRWGTQVGGGMQVNVAPHWDVRGEFDYTKYRNTTFPVPPSSQSVPQSSQVLAGVIYNFF
jgi:opacity protein-like surface antigen